MEAGKSHLLSNEEWHHGWHLTVSGSSDAEGLACSCCKGSSLGKMCAAVKYNSTGALREVTCTALRCCSKAGTDAALQRQRRTAGSQQEEKRQLRVLHSELT